MGWIEDGIKECVVDVVEKLNPANGILSHTCLVAPNAGTVQTLSFMAKNTGESAGSFVIQACGTYSSSCDVLNYDSGVFILNPGESKTFNVKITIPVSDFSYIVSLQRWKE